MWKITYKHVVNWIIETSALLLWCWLVNGLTPAEPIVPHWDRSQLSSDQHMWNYKPHQGILLVNYDRRSTIFTWTSFHSVLSGKYFCSENESSQKRGRHIAKCKMIGISSFSDPGFYLNHMISVPFIVIYIWFIIKFVGTHK